jgi:hypothetical protein
VRSTPTDKADVEAIWKPKPSQKIGMRTAGQTPVNFHELKVSGQYRFDQGIRAAVAASPHGAAVEVKDPEAVAFMRTFVTPNDKAGFALDGDNIVSLFKHPDSGIKGFTNSALSLATQNGGRRLDAFDTVLPGLYSENGFRAVARLAWNDKYAPPGWDYQKFGAFNGGRPDVVFMVYDPASARAYKPGDGKRVASYDEGVAAQTEVLKALDAAHAAREQQIPSAKPPSSPTTAMTQQELFPGKFPDLPPPKKKVEAADFAKDNVPVAADDPEKMAKFVETWNDHVGEAPAEFQKEFLGGIPGTMQIRYEYYENPRTGKASTNEMRISGYIKDADGVRIGEYTRKINFVSNTAESAYFALTSHRQQGKNLGKQMLAANVAMYQKMGLDRVNVHADIDVGGYAWAKYGYVPNDDSWDALRSDLNDKLGRGSGTGSTPDSWEEMSSSEQDDIFEKWKDDSFHDFYDSEVENWRDSGQALQEAKTTLASDFDGSEKWATDAVQKWRAGLAESEKVPLTNEQILAATSIDKYSDRYDEGKADPDITIDEEATKELTGDQRDAITSVLVDAFNAKAERDSEDIDPPDYLRDSVAEYQGEYWDQMDDADKYRWAEQHGELPTREGEGSIDADETDRESLQALLDDDDPKAIWAVADSKLGKGLLLNSDWYGKLDLHDPDTMTRFNAYVGRKPKEQPLAQAA